jgi:nanoRNase/pAp phosphatase (c-di-AMP/oligoRNAs hydrolase)
MDPRTGLGYHKNFRVSNYSLMADLIQYTRTMEPDHILQLPDVQERVDRYFEQENAYQKMLQKNCKIVDNILVINLLNEPDIAAGNRFKEYAMWPEQNISLRIFWGLRKEAVVFSCGHSIINRSSQTNVGELMLAYGGGGHTRVGTCQVPEPEWEKVRDELLKKIREDAGVPCGNP